jgi:hypothetical protein
MGKGGNEHISTGAKAAPWCFGDEGNILTLLSKIVMAAQPKEKNGCEPPSI